MPGDVRSSPESRFSGLRTTALGHLRRSFDLAEQRHQLLRQMETAEGTLLRDIVRQWEEATRQMRNEEEKAQDWFDLAEDFEAMRTP